MFVTQKSLENHYGEGSLLVTEILENCGTIDRPNNHRTDVEELFVGVNQKGLWVLWVSLSSAVLGVFESELVACEAALIISELLDVPCSYETSQTTRDSAKLNMLPVASR